MILLSVTNVVENHDENTESLSYQKSHLPSSVMTESFVAELTVDDTGFPGYIGMTHDDRIIVYSEFQDPAGFELGITILSHKQQGYPSNSGNGISFSDMNVDREIVLPGNFTYMRTCTPILHLDDSISLACSKVGASGAPNILRLDFPTLVHNVTNGQGTIFNWDADDNLTSIYPLNETYFQSRDDPLWISNNFTYFGVSQLGVSTGVNFELNGTNFACPSQIAHACTMVFEFDKNGNILQKIFAKQYNNNGYCAINLHDYTESGHIELYTYNSQGCMFYDENNNLLFSYIGMTFVILDSSFNDIQLIPETPFPNNGGACGSAVDIKDIETTAVGIVYLVQNNPSGPCTQVQGINSSLINGNPSLSIVMLNFSATTFPSQNNIDWAYTWRTQSTSTSSLSTEIRAYGGDKLYWVGPFGYTDNTVKWSSEVEGRISPNLSPTDTGQFNSIANIFSTDSTWLKSISNSQYNCLVGDFDIRFQSTANGFSCYVWRDQAQYSSSFDILGIDSDDDGFANTIDSFVNDSTQHYDTDLDGYGDNPTGFQPDSCVTQIGNSTIDRFGCSDLDGDGMSDLTDAFVLDSSQTTDSDNDGYGDNLTGFRGDSCPTVFGESNRNGTFGCIDYDFDGWADLEDAFPYDSSQWSDWDGDGFGDELIGYEGDSCPSQYGNSTNDRYGCLDDDGDGWSNAGDDFISNPTQYSDVDGDGYGDNQSTGATMSDAFPNDGTQWNDTDGDGHGDNQYGNQGDWFPNDPSRWQDSDGDGYADEDDAFINDASQWNDTDGDGYGDEANGNQADAFPNDPLEWQDSDGDGYGNNADAFPVDGTQWNDTDGDGHGDNPYGTQGDWFPNDPNRWQDSDRDGYADEDDAFVNDASQWNDSDGDGYGDEANGNRADEFPDDPLEWQDSDGDGYGNNADAFPVDGTQWNDIDGDGYGDNPYGTQGDWFPDDPNRWQDSDRDGYANEDDLFPNDITQWNDTDGDGYGDNQNGNNGDAFPQDSTEWKDSDEDGVGNNADQYPYDPTQTVDSDGDGYGDNTDGTRGDAFPQDDTEWSDIDSDGYGDNSDLFPSDGTQWNDTDGDGYGDNLNGANGDACPLIAGNSSIILLGCVDTDGDGYADQIDAFISDALSWSDVDGDSIPDELDAYPNDATQSLDSDGDGFGDNPVGTNADKFPDDPIQWGDIDGDGYGDNPAGNNSDAFITDATQWADSDGDGYGDNPQGRLYDMFPDNPTQWQDEDGDGLGDNQSGTDADPFLNDFDNDGFNDAIDILPKLSSPGDLDADGCLDDVDAFPENPQECVDTDNDGVGDNADSDDDDDGWTDAAEIRLDADPLSASDQPVDSFEIVIPGTAVGLGAWDLIGIFGGVPLFAWIAFGFATRNGRCDKYEELLRQATSRDELEQVALRWEYSLMLRMLGPHQGIRLERLRSELDDKFEFGESTEPEDIGVNQTSLVEREAKELPPIEAKSETHPTPSKDTPATSTDDEGYEWLKDESGMDWYRAADSGDDWAKFES